MTRQERPGARKPKPYKVKTYNKQGKRTATRAFRSSRNAEEATRAARSFGLDARLEYKPPNQEST